MNAQQMSGMALLLFGVAALIFSAGVAWTLARLSRTRQVEGTGLLIVVSLLLLVMDIVLCWLGVSTLAKGE